MVEVNDTDGFTVCLCHAPRAGRTIIKYTMAPLDKLGSLPDAARYLRPGITLDHLHQLARALSDVQAADEINEARAALFRRVPARA